MTKPKNKLRQIQYRRAVWDSKGDTPESSDSLETYLKSAHNTSKQCSELTFSCGSYDITCANFKSDIEGIYLHLAKYTPGGSTSTIDQNISLTSRQIFSEHAPKDRDYMEGDIFLFIKANHVLVCMSGARINIAIKYFSFILLKLGRTYSAASLDLQIIANVNKLNLIQTEGVKEIILNASLYDASMQYTKLNNTISGWVPKAIHDFSKIFASDKDLKGIHEQENLNVSISIKFDSNEARSKKKKNADFGSVGRKRLESVSKMILDDSYEFRDDDFEIVTNSGQRITPNKMQVSEYFNIEVLGSSLSKEGAWNALKTYYDKLKGGGILEQ